MSVNTPKRLKTAYCPGMPFAEDKYIGDAHKNNMERDPYANPDVNCYMPNGYSGWMHAAPETTTTTNVVLSPTSSYGSPQEEMRDGLATTAFSTAAAAPKTPSTTKERAAILQFPTPTTSTLPDGLLHMNSSSGGRRGRPRSECLNTLMMEGSTSPSSIKCKFCNRVFPREKSLAAHLRTHTGERPYVCDYPGCTKSFTQSGQMKTHQRLHTGERPFICAVPSCEMRFTHANRHCPVHVNSQLKRDDKFVVKMTPEQNEEVHQWLEKYRAEREDKSTPTRKTPQRSNQQTTHHRNNNSTTTTPRSSPATAASAAAATSSSTAIFSADQSQKENLPHTPIQDRSMNGHHNGGQSGGKSVGAEERSAEISSTYIGGGLKRHQNDENECPVSPSTPSHSNNPYKSRKGLMVELDMNAGLAFSPLAPLKMKPQPKLIQWQEPLSQEEDDDDDDEDGENNENAKYYQNYQKNNASPLKVNLQQPKTPQKKENKLQSPRKFNSPSKKALKLSSSTFNPKKKWLREACLEDLAKPLDQSNCGGALGSPQKLQIKSMNLLRPTVLMLASKDKQIPLLENGSGETSAESSGPPVVDKAAIVVSSIPEIAAQGVTVEMDNQRKWLGKMALMQLATEEVGVGINNNSGTHAAEVERGKENGCLTLSNSLPVVPVRSSQCFANNTTVSNGIGTELPEYTQL